MTARNSLATKPERQVVLTRDFDAPRRLVFETWVRREHLVRWWGPKGFTLPVCEMEFRRCRHLATA